MKNSETGLPQEEKVTFSAIDGQPLEGNWLVPKNPVLTVVIVCGGGIPAIMYKSLARHLSGQGMAVLTFDYRGIGRSRRGSLRGFEAGIEHWGVLDFGAALALAARRFPRIPLGVVAHSIGTLLVGAAPEAGHIARLVLLAPHTGYFRDYASRWKWALYLTWHVFMPLVTKFVGFFPGRALGLGEDLPRGFAMDWARRRQPSLLGSDDDDRRFGPILAKYDRLACPTLVLGTSDDAFAPPVAGRRLLASYPRLRPVVETVSPSDLRVRHLGHFAFLRRATGVYFWRRIAAWLLQGLDPEAAPIGSADERSRPPLR